MSLVKWPQANILIHINYRSTGCPTHMSPVLPIVVAFHHVALERQETTVHLGCCNPTLFSIYCGRCTGLVLGVVGVEDGGSVVNERSILLSMMANGFGSSGARTDMMTCLFSRKMTVAGTTYAHAKKERGKPLGGQQKCTVPYCTLYLQHIDGCSVF